MRMKNKPLLAVMLLAGALALQACSSVKKELGVGRNSPDEFLVVKRAPLTLPPDYALRPPANPDETAAAEQSADKAKTALLGKTEEPVVKGDTEAALLGKVGAGAANPDIRRLIDEENGYISLKNRTVAEKLIFWDDEQPSVENVPSSLVDPQAEAARIRKNQAEGKPINEGDVPVIEKKKNTLEKIF